MIGDGPLRKRLEKKVEETGLSSNFYFTGEISRRRYLDIWTRQISLPFLPVMRPLGFRFWKQFQKKVPVVAMNHSGVSDIIKNGVNGYLADNLAEFSFYLQTLIESPALRTSFAREASKELSIYDWNRIYEQTNQVYAKVIYEKHHNNN
ncbi:glycosyltransferase [Methanosarcina horonobensis]|uniref:glycosyltransferase n=1 Tax=Methanosarcina horonobensis TaxID=418008 RepID=UPI000A5D66E7|nr:glycosyltransferase [Methanosarcina horonobensis]